MTKLRPEQVEDWVTEKANRAFSRHIQFDQGRFVKACPANTGRMASSFFIGRSKPDTSTRPEDWAPEGAERREAKDYSDQIEMDGTWHISNNVPYAVPVAKDPKWAKGGDGGAGWFTSIANASRGRLEEELRKEFRGQ
jgi:hypothetical protein